ncbi:MAG: META domain-containing protein [Cellulomonas sp.]
MRASSRVILGGLAILLAGGAVFAMTRSGGGASLKGTSWALTAASDSSFDPATVTITAEFTDTQISGSSGVNRYSGGYTTSSSGDFSVGQLISTLMAGPEADMQAETAYLKLLAAATTYRVEGDQLILLNADGTEDLTYAAVT